MGNKDNQVQRISVRRMTGLPLLTDCEGIFGKIEFGNRRTVIYNSVKPFGFGKKIHSIKPKPHFSSANSDMNLEKLKRMDYRA